MALLVQPVTVDANHPAVERLGGFVFREDSSAAAVIELRIATVGGALIWPLALKADESAGIVFPKGVFISTGGGCYVNEVSGSVEGVLFYPAP